VTLTTAELPAGIDPILGLMSYYPTLTTWPSITGTSFPPLSLPLAAAFGSGFFSLPLAAALGSSTTS